MKWLEVNKELNEGDSMEENFKQYLTKCHKKRSSYSTNCMYKCQKTKRKVILVVLMLWNLIRIVIST